MNDEETYQREGYMLFVDPVIGLLRLFMTSVSAWVVLEVLSTPHGRQLVQHIPAMLKAATHALI